MPEPRKLIDLSASLKSPFLKPLLPLIEGTLAAPRINEIYLRAREMPQDQNFFDRVLRATNVNYVISAEDRDRIPVTGPLIVVANHPLGGIDGVALTSLLLSVRPDVKMLVNFLLSAITEMNPWFIHVDPFGGADAARANLKPLKDTLKWLKAGGCLGTFPSGTVSHLHLNRRQVTDPAWNDNVAGLVRRTGATVLPVYFSGRNSGFFQAMGLLHPRLRTAMLAREVLKMDGKLLNVRVGNPIPAQRLVKFEDDGEMMEFLRLKTYILKNRPVGERKRKLMIRMPRLPRPKPAQEPLVPAVDPERLEREVAALPPHCLMAEHGDFAVFVAEYGQLPAIMQEIGRLREKTFREVGEGTGTAIDLDDFDPHYLQLFMWNRSTREVVGGYRLGLTDQIFSRLGHRGLYTTTLFRFKDSMLTRLNPALEVGRSFIRSEYQRKHLSLSLIWRGIGEFISRNPRYRVLFGPVSISKDYQALSRDLMVQFLRNNSRDSDMRPLVKARHPPRSRRLSRNDKQRLNMAVKDIEDVSALVSEIETDRKGVPVLLRHYLKLNATILSFNVDKDFCDVIDGLVVVDLMRTDPKILRRFMSEDGATRFIATHALTTTVT